MDTSVGTGAGAAGSVVGALLRLVRDELGMDAAAVCELTSDREVLHALETRVPMPLAVGESLAAGWSLGHRVAAGVLPRVCPDALAEPAAASLPSVCLGQIGSWAATTLSVGRRTVLVVLLGSRPCRLPDDVAGRLEALARELAAPLADAFAVIAARAGIEAVLVGGGPRVVAQPVVELATGRRLGVETLARFPDGRGPDHWFAEAAAGGLGVPLELAAARRSALLLDRTDGSVAINFSATALVDPAVLRFLGTLPLARVVVELTEQQPVRDYPTLVAALAPLRRGGLGLAVDDAGAGFASLRHVLRLGPDWVKIDQSIVTGAEGDPARTALLAALVVFARGAGVRLIAEGVETAGEAALVRRLGVDCAQGWYLGRPVPPEDLPRTGSGLAPVPWPRQLATSRPSVAC